MGMIRRRACLRLIPFLGTGDVLLAPTMISHPLAYVAPTTRRWRCSSRRKQHRYQGLGDRGTRSNWDLVSRAKHRHLQSQRGHGG